MRHWRKVNPERKQALDRAYRERTPSNIRHAGEDPKKRKAWKHRYRQRHQDAIAAYGRNWKQKNPEKVAAQKARRKARKENLPDTLTSAQAERLLKIGRAMYPGEELHLDHVVPLSRGGGTTLANMHAIPARLNCFKGDALPEQIYTQLILEMKDGKG